MSNQGPTLVSPAQGQPLFWPYDTTAQDGDGVGDADQIHYESPQDTLADAGADEASSGSNEEMVITADPLPASSDHQHRVQLACMRCRKQKLKCDGLQPSCARCVKRNAECIYSNEPTGRKNGSKKKSTRRTEVAKKKTTSEEGTKDFGMGPITSVPATPRGLRDLVLPSQRPNPQVVSLEQLSKKLRMELDSYSIMAKHWQEQLTLFRKGGPDAVTDRSAVAAVNRDRIPRSPSGRPRFLPSTRTSGESWKSFTPESHPAVHLAHTICAFSDRSLVASPLTMMQDPMAVDLRCHRFRIMRFWDLSSPRELLTDDLSYEYLVAAWEILMQPISTTVQGNTFVDEVGRPLEDDLEETKTMDSIALFAHTSDVEELLSVMEFGTLFFHATQLVGWDDQMLHLANNLDRLQHVAFFQRNVSTVPEFADRTISFVLWYVWRYKAFKMMTAYKTTLNLAYQVLLANFRHVSSNVAASLNILLLTTATSYSQMMTHVHLAQRIPHTPLKKALMGLAIGVFTLNRPESQMHHFEKMEADYPELLRVIEEIHNPFDPDNRAIGATALFLHTEALVRLGRDVRIVEALINATVKDVVSTESCSAIHLLFSNMFMFQNTVNTVVQFTSGVTCTVSDYARIELAKALGFPLAALKDDPNANNAAGPSPPGGVPGVPSGACKLKFGKEFAAALGRLGQIQDFGFKASAAAAPPSTDEPSVTSSAGAEYSTMTTASPSDMSSTYAAQSPSSSSSSSVTSPHFPPNYSPAYQNAQAPLSPGQQAFPQGATPQTPFSPLNQPYSPLPPFTAMQVPGSNPQSLPVFVPSPQLMAASHIQASGPVALTSLVNEHIACTTGCAAEQPMSAPGPFSRSYPTEVNEVPSTAFVPIKTEAAPLVQASYVLPSESSTLTSSGYFAEPIPMVDNSMIEPLGPSGLGMSGEQFAPWTNEIYNPDDPFQTYGN